MRSASTDLSASESPCHPACTAHALSACCYESQVSGSRKDKTICGLNNFETGRMKMRSRTQIAIACFCLAFLAQTANAQPASQITRDAKDPRIIRILATLAQDEPHYHCNYSWSIILNNRRQYNDSCQTDVPDGSENLAVCIRQYTRPVSSFALTQASCIKEGD